MDSFMAGFMPLGLFTATTAPKADVCDGLAALRGTWNVLSVERGGKLDDSFRGAVRTVNKHLYTLTPRNQEMIAGMLTVDPQARTLDMRPANGEFRGKILRGIYEVDGNILKICFAEPGRERPTQFVSMPGSGHILVIQERVE
jgi:uncharacterized protein (TIGR03067 family)